MSNQAVIKITSQWRGYSCLMFYSQTKRGACGKLLQSESSPMRSYLTAPYYCTGIIACQSIHRRLAAQKIVEVLRKEHRVASATSIQTKWRSTMARREFVDTITKVVLVQSTIRKWATERSYSQHNKAATLISNQWRRVRCLLMFKKTVQGEFTTVSLPIARITRANCHLGQT
jgi:myosin heavy subunit